MSEKTICGIKFKIAIMYQSGNKDLNDYFSLVFLIKSEASKTNDKEFIEFIGKAEKLGFSDIELEILTIDSLKNLAGYISFYNGYLHIYSKSPGIKEQIRDIIQDENHTYVSKEERAKIINLFKTLLSRTTKDDLDVYKHESILGPDLLDRFIKIPKLKDLAIQVIEEKLQSGDKTYLERFKAKPPGLQNILKTKSELKNKLRTHCNDSLGEDGTISKIRELLVEVGLGVIAESEMGTIEEFYR